MKVNLKAICGECDGLGTRFLAAPPDRHDIGDGLIVRCWVCRGSGEVVVPEVEPVETEETRP